MDTNFDGATMRNLHPLTGGQAKELDSFQLVEQRLKQLESLVLEMRLELEELRASVSPENQKRLEKMQAYQQELDTMFGLRESA